MSSRTAYPNDFRRHYQKHPDLVRLLGVDQTARALPTRLHPGRYFVTVLSRATTERVWLRFGNFDGTIVAATAPVEPAAGVEIGEGMVFIDDDITVHLINVRPGVNDGVSAIIDSGAATRSLTFTRTAQ